jgi:WD40 repeat protein
VSTQARGDDRLLLVCLICVIATGAEDGSIKVWNFHSGALLSTLTRSAEEGPASQWGSGGGVEVTGLAVASSTDTNGQAAPCVVATGWDRKVGF